MSESKLCSSLGASLRSGLSGSIVIKHAEQSATIVPDFSITWAGSTIWIEVKLVDSGKVKARDIQHEMMKRFSIQGRALYVVYQRIPRLISIFYPEHLYESPIIVMEGWNHDNVVEVIRNEFMRMSK